MTVFPIFGNKIKKALILLLVVPLVSLTGWVQFSRAATTTCTSSTSSTSVGTLQQQQEACQAAAAAAALQAQQQGTLAQRAAASLAAVNNQINVLSGAMQSTQHQIVSVQAQIAQKNQDIAGLESNLRTISDQENALVRQLYIMVESHPDDLALFSDESISDRAQQQQQLTSLEQAATASYTKTKTAQDQVTSERDQLQQQNDNLAGLQTQQQSQQQTLADTQSTQQSLKSNALVAEQQLESIAAANSSQAAKLQAKITSLLAQNFSGGSGGKLLPVEQASWYYSQQDPRWAGDTLGRSSYSVGDFGCLITSIAMLEKRNGNSTITPEYIANNGSFPIGSGLYAGGPGSISDPSGSGNWSSILGKINNGSLSLPLIVELKLSTFYDHFVVLYSVSGGNYLIQDPWSPTGPGYNTSLVIGYKQVYGLM